MKGGFEGTGLLKEGVDRFWRQDRGRGHLPVPCPGRAKGALWFESEDNEAGKREGKENGSRKRQKKRQGKKVLSTSAKIKGQKPPGISIFHFQRMENFLLIWVRCWEHPLRSRGDTEIHQTSRGASAPGGFSEAFGGPGASVGLRRGQNLGKEIEEGSQGGVACRYGKQWERRDGIGLGTEG